ncbi:unnamed protein product [Bursaphelenchus xylophilus]|uniref:(pine wood nematode) hypothetical protein n=1 Tax=Bursaphelenchus xylophilus TaxID=6326 RepID=A0A1I7ST40_BURXY|nr:unnamed protein product [Bursaphelenchus xylophilus]CAG9108749.1 unnamed protein product [Bursaphelenchus xylophilus]
MSTISETQTKREGVVANLKSIRVGKTKLLAMLGSLKEAEQRGEEIDKTLIGQLVEAYDKLKIQEDEYLTVLKDIIQQHFVEYKAEKTRVEKEREAEETVLQPVRTEEEQKLLDEFLKEIDEVEESARAAYDRNEELMNKLREKLEQKQVIDHLNNVKEAELDKTMAAKERVLAEKEALARAEQVRDRLKKEFLKRGLAKRSDEPLAEEILPSDCSERVPEIPKFLPEPRSEEEKAMNEKIQKHIESIKTRRQRMKECGLRLNDMMDISQNIQQAVVRTSNIGELQKKLEDLKTAESEQTEESPAN